MGDEANPHFIHTMKTAFVFLACAIVVLCAAAADDDIPVTEFTEDSPVDELDQEHTATHVGSKHYECSRILYDIHKSCPHNVKNWSVGHERTCKRGAYAKYAECKRRGNRIYGHHTSHAHYKESHEKYRSKYRQGDHAHYAPGHRHHRHRL